ncbi:CMP-N-acetylneuraminate-beta-galactosamide-alpha-2,3-sialyltransferase 1 [Triplophysa tibetana]|uniref:CMP-N-acetylneuraminate-beta-galactosamide-alpha-2,3-sialyltransferase 1 n=1 Tax=Triplophysa tibetana TaxID=1572043 RepID=A0A5A9NL65_9TELE|nr:CMP-N-acetylneuraminate-beta-galactosamide-alpha-2,3-sialyltransferase 1 [Triplophysa tibetana]
MRHPHRYLTLFLSSTIVMFCFYFQNSVVIFPYNSYFRYVSEPAPCGCDTCALDRGRTDWFSAHYKPTVHLLLNSSNSVLNTEVFRWWKGLQIVTRVADYTRVVKNLFPLFPDKEHYSDGGPDRCRTCAVVGNSGNLLRSHYGPLIDYNDFVMRINKGPTEGFEKDVGSRTTHRIIYPESSVDMDNSTHLVFFPFKILDMEWLISAFTTKNIIKINKGPMEGFEKDVGSRTTHRIMYPESSVDMDNSTHLVFFPFKILDMEWLISAFTTKNIIKKMQSTIKANKDKGVVKNLFPLFPDKEHYSDAGPDTCRTCAVVGNSGNLLRSHYGSLIDSNDFVMRINKGPMEGFEKDVGSRTTHRIMYP